MKYLPGSFQFEQNGKSMAPRIFLLAKCQDVAHN